MYKTNKIKIIKSFKSGIFLWISFLFAIASPAIAILPSGPVNVSATPDTNQIRIGEQFKINLKANVSTGTNIIFPIFADTINKFEIVSKSEIDTSMSEDKSNVTLSQTYTVTGFDSGYFVVEPFNFTILNQESAQIDTFPTEAFLISVKTIPVDTTQAIKDIKAPLSVSMTLKEILLLVVIIVGGLFLIWFIIRLWKNRKRKEAPILPKIPAKPAYEIALEALRKTEQEKLWQQGFYKPYHSAVSDTLREYIERTYDINALELTSDETLERIKRLKLKDPLSENLAFILRIADFVKFAKVVPMADENEKVMQYAYHFIHSTRPVTEADLNGKESTS